MIKSFSVIVPVYNCEKVIERTVDSIQKSILFFKKNYPQSDQVKGEIIVVNDASNDHTIKVINWLIQRGYPVTLINHEARRGEGATRNTGVQHSTGEILFFCDGDDLFLPGHIYVCYMMLNSQFSGNQVNLDRGNRFSLKYQGKIHQIPLLNKRVDAVKTSVRIRDSIHPSWRRGINQSLTINLCIFRECHDFIGGYPEDDVYVKIGREDCAYNQFIAHIFQVITLGFETVEYVRYPGNSFDRQYETYQFSPEANRTDISAEEAGWHQTASQLEKKRLETLLLKRKTQPLSPVKSQTSEFSWQRINLNFNSQNYDFFFPRRNMADVVTYVFKGKGYPLVKLPNYLPHTIIDIGANIGATAVYFHFNYPNAKIFCYEPTLEKYRYLKENTKAFSDQIKIFHYGLSDQNCELPDQGTTNTAQNSVIKSGETSQVSEVIKLRNIKEELKRLSISKISILKIDTEGCEIEILKNLFDYTQNIDIIYLEYHSENDRCDLDELLAHQFTLFKARETDAPRSTEIYLSRDLLDRYPKLEVR